MVASPLRKRLALARRRLMSKWLSLPALDSDSRIWLSTQRAAVEAYLNRGRWQSWSRNMALTVLTVQWIDE